MDYKTEYQNYQIHAFWSKEITDLVGKITSSLGKSYAGQHDLVLEFVNDTFFQGKGTFTKEFRVKGAKYPDLKVPVKDAEREFEIVELKVHTSQLKYLRAGLNRREEIFSTSDHLYFSYLLQVVPKKGKSILARNCIYYLVVIIISKPTLSIPINELISEIRMGTKHFTEELKEKSGIDEEKEELLGVDNIIKAVDLERKLSEKEHLLEEKDHLLEEKDHLLEEKEAELEKERKLRKERENEIKRLKALLKDK
jgi:hypothetical protein